MAITNAQQYKQLLAKGGRTGFFLGSDYDKNTVSKTTSAQKSASKPSTTTYTAPSRVATNPQQDYSDEAKGVGAYAPGVSQAYEVIGGEKYAVDSSNPDNREERRILNDIEDEKYNQEVKDFIDKGKEFDSGFPSFFGMGVNAFGRFNNPKQRAWFAANVANNKYGYTLEDYDKYLEEKRKGNINAYGRQLTDGEKRLRDGDGGGNNYIPPIIPEGGEGGEGGDDQEPFIPNYRLMADGGMTNDAPAYEGGIMDLESSRQMYGLGKLVKKITRGVKKIAKSPIGKAALLYFGGQALSGGKGLSSFFGKGSFNPLKALLTSTAQDGATSGMGLSKFGVLANKFGLATGEGALTGLGQTAMIGLPSILSGLITKKEEDDDDEELYAGADIDDPKTIMNDPYKYINRRLVAEGGSIDEPVAKKTMPLLDMDGQEMDLREEGGFVPLGRMERADDVPARLSKNEFVFTADAVRNAGEGDVDKGAEVMYNMMKNLESGGEVSEESQGLEGAREMFQTSQRLEEVI